MDELINSKPWEIDFEHIFNITPDLIFILDTEYNILRANDSFAKRIGLSSHELIGSKCYRCIHQAEEPPVDCPHSQMIKNGLEHTEKMFSEFLKGWFSVAVKPLKDEQGKVCGSLHIARDITERKKAEDILSEGDVRLKKLSVHVPGMIYQFIKKPDGTYCVPFTTEAIRDIFGCSPQDVLNDFSPIARVILPEDLQKVVDTIEYSAKTLTTWQCEYRVQIPGQSIQWMFGQSTPERIADGSIIWHGFNTDITERKQAELQLRKLNRTYSLLSEINQMIVRVRQKQELFDEACKIAVSQGGFRMAWIGLLDTGTKQVKPVAYAGDAGNYLESLKIILNESERGHGPTATALLTGKHNVANDIASDPRMTPWHDDALQLGYLASAVFPFNIAGELRGTLTLYAPEKNFFDDEELKLLDEMTADIAFALEYIEEEQQRKLAQNKLSRSEEDLRKAQEITHVGSFYVDFATNQVTWTEELYKMYGFDPVLPPPLLNESQTLFTPESWELLSASIANTGETGVPYEIELKTLRKDGTNGWMWAKGEAIRDPKGKISGIWGAVQDISKSKFLEEELIIAKEKAEASDRLKSAFLANMSHEIRTPMNGILGFAELLKEPYLTGEEQQQYINIIDRSGKRMLNIINDIVSISRIEAGQMGVSVSATQINDQIRDITNFFTPEAERKGILLQVNNKLPLKESLITTDREKLYAILTNLAGNAIKFTHAGFIELGVDRKADYLEFYVKDTGIGIPENQKELIFERFRQGDDLTNRFNEGTGLGLSISKAYVELLGGKIWLDSKLGEGSIFYFTLPYFAANETEPTVKKNLANTSKEKINNDLKILIVEDDEDSKNLITTVIKKFGKEILYAATGGEAIEACRVDPDIDLVLMDIRMPEMDGYEATRQIRQFNKEVIILAQTAFAMLGDREKAIEAGCNDYISKPIKIDVFKELINKYVNK